MIVIVSIANNSTYNLPKIKTVKALQAATGLGLKEAKDIVDSAENRTVRLRMTAEQLGMMIANLDTDMEDFTAIRKWWDISVDRIEDTPPADFDTVPNPIHSN